MLKSFLPLLFLCCSAVKAQSQSPVTIYSDAKSGDTIYAAAQSFMSELKRSVNISYNLRPAAQFASDGIVLLKTKEADKYKITYPASLRGMGPEGIYISAGTRSLKVVGNTALAVQEALYIYLEQLGYRYLLPGDHWTVIPKLNGLYKKTEILVAPDFEYRTIANGHGYLNSAQLKSDFDNWYKANRLGGAFNIWLGHSYDWIVSQRPEAFKQHPEYFAEPVTKGTIPAIFKFNVANKDLVKLVKEVAEQEMKKGADKDVWPKFFSMEPSDGGGYCTTPECKAIGGPSDQAFYLANEVAKVAKKYGVIVGSYAYNEHIVPTRFKLEPNMFVMVTNGFNWSKYSTTELLELWGKKASRVGVYEYLSVYEGDMDMPGANNVSRTGYLQKSVKDFYKAGARSYQGESTIGWISRGLGQYLLSRLVWNRNVNADSVKKDFFVKAFEQSAEPMQRLYAAWESNRLGTPSENSLVDWHQWINEAYSKASNPLVKRRIEDVMVYLHYVVMYTELQKKKTDENILRILRYAHRTKDRGLFATVPAMVSLGNYTTFPQYGYYVKPNQQVWMDNNSPVSSREILDDFRSDAKKFKKQEGITGYARSENVVPLRNIFRIPDTKYTEGPHTFWGATEYVIQIKKQGAENYFDIKSGYSAGPPKALDVTVSIYKQFDAKGRKEDEQPILQFGQSKKYENERFSLASLKPGYYSVIVTDWQKMFILQFSNAIDHSILALPEMIPQTTTGGGYNTFYFYVPPGTKRFTVLKSNLNLISPKGRDIKTAINTSETFTVEVQAGESGIWKIYNQAGHFYLEGVPPYFGQHPERMLVPSSVK